MNYEYVNGQNCHSWNGYIGHAESRLVDLWFFLPFLYPTDYDRDGYIGQSDLKSVITALTLNELTPEEHDLIAENVLEEADVDGDGKLSFSEFDHVVSRAPDFLNTFHIRL